MTLILSGTDGLSDVDGSAATPAIRGTDTNTGIFFPGADRVGFATGGTQRGEFDASGNLQLNTANTKLLNSSGRTMLNQTGAILQVVQNSTVGNSSTTSTTAVDITNFTVTITPSSTSSKILILASARLTNSLVAATNVIYHQTLVRTSTTLVSRHLAAESGSGGLQAKGSLAISYLDSPSTTSATTYKIQHYSSSASSTVICDEGWIIAMEISG